MKTSFISLILFAGLLPALPAGAQGLPLEACRAPAVEHNRTLRDSRYELGAARRARPPRPTGAGEPRAVL